MSSQRLAIVSYSMIFHSTSPPPPNPQPLQFPIFSLPCIYSHLLLLCDLPAQSHASAVVHSWLFMHLVLAWFSRLPRCRLARHDVWGGRLLAVMVTSSSGGSTWTVTGPLSCLDCPFVLKTTSHMANAWLRCSPGCGEGILCATRFLRLV